MKDNQGGNENIGNENPPPQCLLCGNIAFILTDCGVKCNLAGGNLSEFFYGSQSFGVKIPGGLRP